MRRMTRHTLRNISSLNANQTSNSAIVAANVTSNALTSAEPRSTAGRERRSMLQSGDSMVGPPSSQLSQFSSSASRGMLLQSTELLSPAETFLQPFEPVLTRPGASPLMSPSPAVGVFPPRAFAWRHLDDLSDTPSVFESNSASLNFSSMSVHDVEIPEDIQDVRPAPLIRSPRSSEPDDAGFWGSK